MVKKEKPVMICVKLIQIVNFAVMIALTIGPFGVRSTAARTIERVDVSAVGAEGNDGSGSSSVNAAGNDVAFSSEASNLVDGDLNGKIDVFVYDWANVDIARVSVDSSGTEGDGDSNDPVICAEGRYVAFSSAATNLVAGDSNARSDIFVYDRSDRVMSRVSVGSGGAEGDGGSREPALSGDGRYVAFTSAAANLVPGDSNGRSDIFVYDRTIGTMARVSDGSGGAEGDGDSSEPALSEDGRYVAFTSDAANLVPGDSNGRSDIFVYDRTFGTMARASVSSGGDEGDGGSREPALSGDGRYVAFTSDAKNLVAGDSNGRADIFLFHRSFSTIERVSVDNLGTQGNDNSQSASLNDDGDSTVFASLSSNLVSNDANGQRDIFISIADSSPNDADDDDDEDEDYSGTVFISCFIDTILGR